MWDCDLCLCGRIRVSGSPHSRVFYAVIGFSMECFTAISSNFAAQLSKFFFWLADWTLADQLQELQEFP